MYLTWKLLLAGKRLLLCRLCAAQEADVAMQQGIMTHSLLHQIIRICLSCLLSPGNCVCPAYRQPSLLKKPFRHHLWYVTDMEIIHHRYCRHEERERKAATHVSWWKRLTHATATHTSHGETQNGPQREQLAQEPVEDVEAGPAGMSNIPSPI